MHEISKHMKIIQVFMSQRAWRWCRDMSVISFTSVGGNGVKQSISQAAGWSGAKTAQTYT